MKKCSKCGIIKPLEDFSRQQKGFKGRVSKCKACEKIYRLAFEAANPGHRLELDRAWRKKNAERKRANVKAYVARHREKVREYKARHYVAEDKEARREYYKQWRVLHREASTLYSSRRRALTIKRGKLSNGLAEKLYKLQKGKCACCGIALNGTFHLDHIMPLALGGENEDWNIQLLSASCNSRKQAKHPIDYMQSKGFLL